MLQRSGVTCLLKFLSLSYEEQMVFSLIPLSPSFLALLLLFRWPNRRGLPHAIHHISAQRKIIYFKYPRIFFRPPSANPKMCHPPHWGGGDLPA